MQHQLLLLLVFSTLTSGLWQTRQLKFDSGESYCTFYNSTSLLSLAYKYQLFPAYDRCQVPQLPSTTSSSSNAILSPLGVCSFTQLTQAVNKINAHLLIVVVDEKVSTITWNVPSIPVLFVSAHDGWSIKNHLLKSAKNSLEFKLTKENTIIMFIVSEIILASFALITVILGALYTAKYLRFDILEKSNTVNQEYASIPSETKNRLSCKFIFVIGLALMLSGILFLVYMFYYPLVIFTLGSLYAMCNVLYPLVVKLPLHQTTRIILILIVSFGLVLYWFVNRNSLQIWFLHNVLSMFFLTYAIGNMMPADTSTVLLILFTMLVYDIFFVFVTPLLTHGISLMTSAVDPQEGGLGIPSCLYNSEDEEYYEKLPVIFNSPVMSHCDCSNFLCLGFGDIAIPGVFITQCLRFDLSKSSNKVYFSLSVIGYLFGVILSFVALYITSLPQPGLLYIIPSVLVPVLILMTYKEHLHSFLSYTEPDNE